MNLGEEGTSSSVAVEATPLQSVPSPRVPSPPPQVNVAGGTEEEEEEEEESAKLMGSSPIKYKLILTVKYKVL